MTIDYHKFKETVKVLISNHPKIEKIAQYLFDNGADVYIVGGTVRDVLLDLQVADIDIEVHNISLDILSEALKKFGVVSYVGKSFGVLKLHGSDIDWSIPRRDSAGRKPVVDLALNLSIKEAFSRRDLTINAMGINLKNFELVDPFNGMQDLRSGILRAPDIVKFQEDPLRFYRVMQFISRFAMQPDDELNAVCRSMDISKVSVERIEMEFEKMLLKSVRPSLGLRWLSDIGRVNEVLPQLGKTIGVMQNPEYHPEGDVFEHAMQAVDAAADYEYETQKQKLTIIFAALCHDLGKADTTEIRKGRITSYRHDIVGAPLAKKMLKRVTTKKQLIDTIVLLVRHHMAPPILVRQGAKFGAYKKLAKKLAPLVSMRLLGLLSLADRRGRNGKSHMPLPAIDQEIQAFFAIAQEINVLDMPEEPILQGRDLIDVIKPGPKLGQALSYAYDLQINEGIKDRVELKKRVIKK